MCISHGCCWRPPRPSSNTDCPHTSCLTHIFSPCCCLEHRRAQSSMPPQPKSLRLILQGVRSEVPESVRCSWCVAWRTRQSNNRKSHQRTSMRASNRDLRFSAWRSQGCGLLDSWPHAHFVETHSQPQRTLVAIGRLDNAVAVA